VDPQNIVTGASTPLKHGGSLRPGKKRGGENHAYFMKVWGRKFKAEKKD